MGVIKKFLLKVAGKDDFQLDNRIGIGYLLFICWKYSWMMLRGKLISFTGKDISSNIFIGRHVQLIERKYLKIGLKTKIHDRVKIDALSTDGVSIGDNVVLGHDSVIECTGSLSHIGKGVRIGNRTSFGSNCFLGAAGGIEIGEDVLAGQFVRFHSENHRYDNLNMLIREQGVTHKGIKIGNNCWIGSGVVFLDGSEIGDGCVVAANAVVGKKFPGNCVIGGVPAKVIKKR